MISNVSEIRGMDEGMLVTLLLLMLEVPGRPGAVVPRETLEIVGVVQRWAWRPGCKRRRKGCRKKDGQTTNINAGDGNVDGGKGGNARCNRCGEVGHKNGAMPRTGV